MIGYYQLPKIISKLEYAIYYWANIYQLIHMNPLIIMFYFLFLSVITLFIIIFIITFSYTIISTKFFINSLSITQLLTHLSICFFIYLSYLRTYLLSLLICLIRWQWNNHSFHHIVIYSITNLFISFFTFQFTKFFICIIFLIKSN